MHTHTHAPRSPAVRNQQRMNEITAVEHANKFNGYECVHAYAHAHRPTARIHGDGRHTKNYSNGPTVNGNEYMHHRKPLAHTQATSMQRPCVCISSIVVLDTMCICVRTHNSSNDCGEVNLFRYTASTFIYCLYSSFTIYSCCSDGFLVSYRTHTHAHSCTLC